LPGRATMTSPSLITAMPLSAIRDTAKPVLVVGPSLGTSAEALWGRCAALLADRFRILAWDLPGHGRAPAPDRAFTIKDLAADVIAAADAAGVVGSFVYAGDSVGGAVGLKLLIDSPARVCAAALLCTGAKIGDPQGWAHRAATVRAHGTEVMAESSARRWFAPGFADREPAVAAALLDALRHADRSGYAAVCDALAGFDVRGLLRQITAPVIGVAGRHDVAVPVETVSEMTAGIPGARLVVLDEVAHLPPAEDPQLVAALLGSLGREPDRGADTGSAGCREAPAEVYVSRALAGMTRKQTRKEKP
jgi:3-oxoadipate enol-lactonase / 4-carboxymuconolactone decarboxylase